MLLWAGVCKPDPCTNVPEVFKLFALTLVADIQQCGKCKHEKSEMRAVEKGAAEGAVGSQHPRPDPVLRC